MTSERVQRRIDGLLDQAEEAVDARDWSAVDEIARSVLAVDPENGDALAFQAMAGPHVGGVGDSSLAIEAPVAVSVWCSHVTLGLKGMSTPLGLSRKAHTWRS